MKLLYLPFLLFLLPHGEQVRSEHAERAKALKESDLNGRFKLGVWCEERQLWDLCLKEYESVLKQAPDHVETRKRLGYIKEEGSWRQQEAERKKWKYRRLIAAGIKFPSDRELSAIRKKYRRSYRKALDILLDRNHWVTVLQTIDEKTGLLKEDLEVKVVFEDSNFEVVRAWANGVDGKGIVSIDFKKLGRQYRDLQMFERLRKNGSELKLVPAQIPTTFQHELVHIYQGRGGAGWFREGMAVWCSPDPHYIANFNAKFRAVPPITQKLDSMWVYARGWAFFEYYDAIFGRKKVRSFLQKVFTEQKTVPQAASEVSGVAWEKIVEQEQSWSQAWFQK